jgi:hypothetical protein
MQVKHKAKLNKRVIVLAVVAVLLVGGGVLTWHIRRSTPAQNQTSTDTPMPDDEPIDFGPPSEEEKKTGDTQKDSNVNQQQQENQQPSGNKTVIPAITDVGHYDQQIEARAFVPGIFEEGTCTFTFTQGSAKVSKTSPGTKDATTTTCKPLFVPRGEFPSSGQWSLVVSYASATAKGNSEPKTFEVH